MPEKPSKPIKKCRQCGRDIPASVDGKPNPSYPFCSQRCRMADLNSWLDADYRLPVSDTSRELID